MRQYDGFFKARLGKLPRSPGLAAALAAGLSLAATGAWAAKPAETAVKLLMRIPVPVASTNTSGGMYAYDISFVDQSTQTYYLGDRSNAAVDVVDASTGKFVKQITASPPFAGVVLNSTKTAANNSLSGPNGVVTGGSCLFAGDGPSRVVSFLLPGGTQVGDLNTGGMFRADEMSFDPKDSLLLVANNADTPPFATLIKVSSSCALTIQTKIVFTFATNGAEQSVWDGAKHKFYQSIPQVLDRKNPGGGAFGQILAMDTSGNITRRFHLTFCQPAGLALNTTTGTLLAGCSVVFDTAGGVWSGTDTNTARPQQQVVDPSSGAIHVIKGVGSSDEVWYNSGDDHWYTGSQGSPYAPHDVTGATLTAQGANTLGVIDGTSLGLDQLVPTFGTPNVLVNGVLAKPSGSGHSVAANSTNNWVFVPAPANNALTSCKTGCIQVFGRKDNDSD